jgi:hypothetical protein
MSTAFGPLPCATAHGTSGRSPTASASPTGGSADRRGCCRENEQLSTAWPAKSPSLGEAIAVDLTLRVDAPDRHEPVVAEAAHEAPDRTRERVLAGRGLYRSEAGLLQARNLAVRPAQLIRSLIALAAAHMTTAKGQRHSVLWAIAGAGVSNRCRLRCGIGCWPHHPMDRNNRRRHQ